MYSSARYKSADIIAARKALGWTQAELANRTCFARGAVVYWEKRQGKIRGSAVSAFVDALAKAGKPIKGYSCQRKKSCYDARAFLFSEVVPKQELPQTPEPQRCGATTRKGKPCIMKPINGKARCKFHGGMSTGARTPEGIERIRQAQLKRWSNYQKNKLAA